MRYARATLAAAVVVVASLPAGAQDLNGATLPPAERYRLRVEYRGFWPTLAGDARKGSDTTEGTLVDVVDELGLEDKRTFEGRGILQLRPGHKIRGTYAPIDYRGDKPVSNTFTYGSTRYERLTRVRTTIKGSYVGADYEWDFVKREKGFFGIMVGARGFDVDTVVLDVSDNAREADTIRVIVPVAGVATRVYAGKLSLQGEALGISAGDRGHMIEIEGSARFHVSDRLAVGAGYRYLDMKGKDGRDEVVLKLSGWQAGVELSL
jgi:hypothetical protein